MGEVSSIALVGMTTLESLGIRSILTEETGITTERFTTAAEFIPFADRMDAYVVSAEEFVGSLDFFLPRKHKTMVVAGAKGSGNNPGQPAAIGTAMDEAELRGRVNGFIKTIRGQEEPTGELSAREIEVLRLIAAGKINKEIADELCISVTTVITHRKNISSKLGVKSVSGLSLYAMMNGII